MKAILTGLGGRGLYWLGNLHRRDDIEIVAFVEPFQGSIDRAVGEHGVARERIFASLDEAIQNTNADFVVDVTPPSVHPEVAFKAFDNGLHVFGEKPLSDNFQTAKKVAAAGTRAGVKHMITQNYRFAAQPRTSRKVLDEGLIGKPGQADIRFYMPWADLPGSHYVTQPFMMINDMMVHHFDLLRYVLNDDPQSVQAITWNQPWGWHAGDACHAIVFRYESGLVATHITLGCDNGRQTSYNGDWHIAGPKGSLDWQIDGTFYSHQHRVEHPILNQRIDDMPVPRQEDAMLDEFFAAIKEDREPECSANDNLKSLAMVFGAIQSSKEGHSIELDEVS